MNGRIYDPLLGRMLSADLAVQTPGNLQAYNRYSYVMNNPLTLVDPTGFYFMQMLPAWAQQMAAAVMPPLAQADRTIDVGIEAHAVYNTVRSDSNGVGTASVTAAGVAITRLTGAMDWAEAVHGEKIVVANGSASTTEITDPAEVASKAVFGAAGMTLTGVAGSQLLAPRLEPMAPKPELAPEVNPTTAPTTQARTAGEGTPTLKDVTIDAGKHPETAQHTLDAQAAGHPDVVTVDRPGAADNRAAATGSLDKVPGKQLDEYPPAMFKEGGQGASVRAITPKDNMGAGASMGNQLRGVPNGTQVRIKVIKMVDGKPVEVTQ